MRQRYANVGTAPDEIAETDEEPVVAGASASVAREDIPY